MEKLKEAIFLMFVLIVVTCYVAGTSLITNAIYENLQTKKVEELTIAEIQDDIRIENQPFVYKVTRLKNVKSDGKFYEFVVYTEKEEYHYVIKMKNGKIDYYVFGK